MKSENRDKKTKFIPKSAKEEQRILLNDNEFFAQTKKYLKPLILSSINLFDLSEDVATELFWKITNDIPIAARRFLEHNEPQRSYRFSTYFGWYIGQKINKIKKLKRKGPSKQ